MQALGRLTRRSGLPVSAPCRPCYALAVRPPRALVVMAASKPIEKLKRAPSAYNVFYQTQYTEIRTRLTKGGVAPTLAQCAQEVKKLWVALSASQKAVYVNKAGAIKAEFELAKKEGRLVPSATKKPKRVGPPRPLTPYAAFTKAEFAGFKTANPTKPVTEIAKLIAAKWKTVPQSQKDAAKAKYDKELVDFKAKEAATAAAAPAPAPPAKAKAATPVKAASPVKAAPAKPAPSPAKAATPAPRTAPPTPAKSATPVRGASVKRSTPAK